MSKTRTQGDGDSGSLVGCIVLFLPEEVEAPNDGPRKRIASVY